jgi:hypothetical protein
MKQLFLIAGPSALMVPMLVGDSFSDDCWIAIARNESTGAFAISTGRQLWEAQRSAIYSAGGPGAAILTWAHGGCAAFATDKTKPGIYGMSPVVNLQGENITIASEEEAFKRALEDCRRSGGQDCEIRMKACCTN